MNHIRGEKAVYIFVVRHGEPIFGDMDYRSSGRRLGEYDFSTSWFALTGEVIKYVADFSSYWSQVNISLAIAVERYVLIAKATRANELLSKYRRRVLYVLTSVWIIIPATLYSILQVSLSGGNQRSVSFQFLIVSLVVRCLTFLDEPGTRVVTYMYVKMGGERSGGGGVLFSLL